MGPFSRSAGTVTRLIAGSPRQCFMDMRSYIEDLEATGDLLHVTDEVSPQLQITAACRQSLLREGPALVFDRVAGSQLPVVGNLFGTTRRIAHAIGLDDVNEFREIGTVLAFLKAPQLQDGLFHELENAPKWLRLAYVRPRLVPTPPCEVNVLEGQEVDLSILPIQTCWPEDAGPLLSFGLVITRGLSQSRVNLGIYRQQKIAKNKLIMRWLSHRGGAKDYQEWLRERPQEPFPLAVAIGADPATLLAAVAPIPDSVSEYQFAGLLRGARTEISRCATHGLPFPSTAEIILEGFIYPGERAAEGPFCDHTGYYNSVQEFPVFTVERVCMRSKACYHTSYMGRPPEDEPSVLARAFNEMFIPILQSQFPEIVDFYLPPAACSYRIALVSIKKRYVGHARRIMMGIWSWLQQFSYTKFIVVVDDDVDVREVSQVLWAISTRADPVRDLMLVENTPIDYLDFASPTSGLGGKLGLDATSKWTGETSRVWGRTASMQAEANLWATMLCDRLGI